MKFESLGLTHSILSALEAQGYTHPTPIQEQAIPAALAGRDVLGCARTGTGKTCAFATPILQRLSAGSKAGRPIRALILTPTRELAIQIQDCFESYGRNLPLKSVVIFGGVGQNPQVQAIQAGCDILVATPGRLKDLHDQGLLSLDELDIFVLDEADRMLDMGFIHDVKKILTWLPRKKQTLFFSATMPKEITQLVDSLLHDPVKIAVDPVSSPVEVIDQSVYRVDKGNKTKLLVQLLQEKQIPSALVFTRTKHGANRVAQDLTKAGVTAAAIHGNKSQTARQAALAGFKDGSVRVLVATDIAARGLDIEALSCVFNYNLPEVPETYIHRIGRTGRAGKNGIAISFCDFSEQDLLRDIERLIGKPLPEVQEHPFPMEVFEAPIRDKNGRIINAEDAEARQAARNRRSQTQSKNASKADAAAPSEGSAPSDKKGRSKGSSRSAAAKETPGTKQPPVKQVKVKPAKASTSDTVSSLSEDHDLTAIRLPGERKYKRPERKPLSALDEIAPALPESEQPVSKYGVKRTGRLQNTFFTPEEQKAYRGEPEPLMDATARLFATRTSVSTPRPDASDKEPTRSGRKKRRSGAAAESAKAEETTGRAQVKSNQSKRRKTAPAAGDAPRTEGTQTTAAKSPSKRKQTPKQVETTPGKKKKSPPAAPAKAAPAVSKTKRKGSGKGGKTPGTERLLSPVSSKKSRSTSRPPKPMPSIYSAHQKDSTEQESLMKPFYLSDD